MFHHRPLGLALRSASVGEAEIEFIHLTLILYPVWNCLIKICSYKSLNKISILIFQNHQSQISIIAKSYKLYTHMESQEDMTNEAGPEEVTIEKGKKPGLTPEEQAIVDKIKAEVAIKAEKQARTITMEDIPQDHIMVNEEYESLDDCPYVKRFYKWAKESEDNTMDMEPVQGSCPMIKSLHHRNPALDFICASYE